LADPEDKRKLKELDFEARLRESEEKYRLLFESAYDGILLMDGRIVVDCNQRAAQIFGCTMEQLKGASASRFIPPVQPDGRRTRELIAMQEGEVQEGEPRLMEMVLCRCDGTLFDVEMSINNITLQGRKMVQVIVRDITERKQMEDWLRYLNMHDKPTGLYNRDYFEEEMIRLQSGRFDPVGIVVCDLDGLKLVNDNLGHAAGDHLLATAAHLLVKCFRESDVVARIGGDEFAVLLPNCSQEVVESACRRIRDNLQQYRKSEPPIPISMSVGWAVKANANHSMWEIFKEADNRMYAEKVKNREDFKKIFAGMVNELRDLDQRT